MTYTRSDFHRDLARSARRVDEEAAPPKPSRAPAWLVYAHDSTETHVAYRTARRALCGRVVNRGLHGRGQHGYPTCEVCSETLKRHRLGGFIEYESNPGRCLGFTKHGKACKRTPLPGGFCPSHKRRP